MTTHQIASDAINLFLESLDHLESEWGPGVEDIERAKAVALGEVAEGTRDEQRMLDTHADLLAYAEMSEALGEYHRDGSGFTSEMVLTVLMKHGYVPRNFGFPGLGGGEWARDFRKAIIAKAKGQTP